MRDIEEIMEGISEKAVITENGEFAFPVDVIGRKLREMRENDGLLTLEKSLAVLAALRAFTPEAIVDDMKPARRRSFIKEMPGYISFLEEVVAAAKDHKLEVVS